MRNLLYIITTIMIITSCRSIDKMVESGNYDQALRYGVDKLIGEKDKKTKYVKGLEKAYRKLNEQDLNQIEHLKYQKNHNSKDRVVQILQRMEDRQTYVTPLLPLISEDGYPATIKLRNYVTLIKSAKIESAEFHYSNAIHFLELAKKNNDKISARNSHKEFLLSNKYFDNYKQNYQHRRKAYEIGQINILIEAYVAGSNVVFSHTSDIITKQQISNLNTTWKKFHTEESGQIIDYIATIEVNNIDLGKERERYNSFTNTKEIVDGQKPLKRKNGEIKKDSLGNIIYTDNIVSVTANIEELIREKTATMSGHIIIIDALNNQHINTIPISVGHIFEDYSCRFRGDKRALTNANNKRMKEYCAPFPSDYDMVTSLAYEYKNAAEKIIKTERLI